MLQCKVKAADFVITRMPKTAKTVICQKIGIRLSIGEHQGITLNYPLRSDHGALEFGT